MGSKWTSDWLTRLHVAKALAVPDLLANPNSLPPPPPPPPAAASGSRKTHRPNDHPIADHLTSALADLFVMGAGPPPQTVDHKRSARKQPNPRACPPAATASAEGAARPAAPPLPAPAAATSPCSGDNSVVAAEGKKVRTKTRKKRGSSGMGNVEVDLAAFSRTEVTVIDSSLPGWKAEKIIFRKGLVWKVRDRKVWNLGRKKRKLGLVEKLGHEKEKDGAVSEAKLAAVKEPAAKLGAEV